MSARRLSLVAALFVVPTILSTLSEEHQKAANDLIEARRKELTPDKPGL